MYTREHCTSGERIRERSVIFPSQWKKRWFVQDVPVHLRIERERGERVCLASVSKDQNLAAYQNQL